MKLIPITVIPHEPQEVPVRQTKTATAWDLIGFDGNLNSIPWLVGEDADGPANVRIKGGRALYEAVIYYDERGGSKVKLARLDATSEGIHQVNRWVDPDTILEVLSDA